MQFPYWLGLRVQDALDGILGSSGPGPAPFQTVRCHNLGVRVFVVAQHRRRPLDEGRVVSSVFAMLDEELAAFWELVHRSICYDDQEYCNDFLRTNIYSILVYK